MSQSPGGSPIPGSSPIGSPVLNVIKRMQADAASPTDSGRESPFEEGKVETYTVLIRPVDYGWVMGDDWEVSLPVDSTIPDLKKLVSTERGMAVNRIMVRMPDGQYQEKKKEKWTLRRNQIRDGSVIQIEPSIRGSWLWNSLDWYIERLIRDINEALDKATDGIAENNRLTVTDLETKHGIFVPPPLGDVSLRTFIRSYPELFWVHLDVEGGLCWVKRAAQIFTTPSYGYFPAQLGTVKHHKERKFNWDKYADIDDRKRVELDFEIPDVSYNIEVLCANDLKRADVFGSSDPLGYIKWFNCVEWVDIGKTAQRRNTLNPEWRDARYTVSVNASFEVENCILLVEFYDVDASTDPNEDDEIGDYLGCVVLKGRELQRLVADGRTAVRSYPLLSRNEVEGRGEKEKENEKEGEGEGEEKKDEEEGGGGEKGEKGEEVEEVVNPRDRLPPMEGAEDDDQEGIKGTVTLKGGKAGFEINVLACKDLVKLPNPTSRPYAVVRWCGDELGDTLPDSKSAQDPQFNETFGIPMLSATTKLEDCELEVQIWGTVGKAQTEDEELDPNYNPDARGIFMGSTIIAGEELVRLFTSTMPYACSTRKYLKQSKNVPIKMRKKPTGGVLVLLGGMAGLVTQPGKKLDFVVVMAERISKFFKVWFTLEWNFVRVHSSQHVRVFDSNAQFDERVRVETAAGAANCLDTHLRIDLFESTEGSIGALDPAYLGMIVIEGQDLSDLADGEFATTKKFNLTLNPTMEPKKQRMVRGGLILRGGGVMCRSENERILIIYAARNLARANFGGFGSSDPFVEITLFTKENGQKANEVVDKAQVVGRTATIEKCLTPVWDETKEIFFIEIPQIREFSERELQKFIKANEKLEKEGKELMDRTMYDEMSLQIAVYDEADPGEKGTCLGVVLFEAKELVDFFESYEPVEGWYPLVKGKDPKDPKVRNASIGSGAEIKIGTMGHRYASPEARRLEREAELEALANAALAAKQEAEALEFARLEREREMEIEAEAERERQRVLDAEEAARKAAESERLFKEAAAKKKADLEAAAAAAEAPS